MIAHSLGCYIYDQPINAMGIHLFQRSFRRECNASHDIIWDAFVSIIKDVGFHVFCERTHVLP
jgi:hypothetical protein